MNKRWYMNLFVVTALFLMFVWMVGCSGNAGLKNGAIKGKVSLVNGGALPAVKIRAEGISGDISRYTITDRSDGTFYVPDVPVGVYDLFFQVEGYEIANVTGSDTSGEGDGSSNGYVDSGVKCYIENGNVYEIPAIYFKRITSTAPGVISGHVYSQTTGQPISGSVVAVNGTAIATVSDINGRYILSNIGVGAQTLVVSKEAYTTTSIEIHIVSDTEVVRDIRLPSATATINGNVIADNYPSLFNTEWANVIVTVDGVRVTSQITAENGNYSVDVPVGPSSYTLRLNHPYVNETIVRVDGPLTDGQVKQASDAHVRWKTGTVTVQVWTNVDQDDNDDRCVVITTYGDGDGLVTFVDTDPPFTTGGTDFMASTVFTNVPTGERLFSTLGASSLESPPLPATSNYADITDQKVNVREGAQTISLFVGGR